MIAFMSLHPSDEEAAPPATSRPEAFQRRRPNAPVVESREATGRRLRESPRAPRDRNLAPSRCLIRSKGGVSVARESTKHTWQGRRRRASAAFAAAVLALVLASPV